MSLPTVERLCAATAFPPRDQMKSVQLLEPPGVARFDLDDAPKLQRFFARLDRESLHCRFGHEVCGAAIRAHALKALGDASWVFGGFVDGELRGVLELYAIAPRKFEVGLIVEQGWRRRGLASALLCHAMCADGVSGGLRFVFARGNWPMRALVMKANARLDLAFDEICAEIDLALQ